MHFLYARGRGLLSLLSLFMLTTLSAQAQNGFVTTVQSFSYTGRIETFTVPQGVTSLTVEARGAQGGTPGGAGGTSGGRGVIIQGAFSVISGESFSLLVGGQGSRSGGGGGSFVVRTNSPAQPLLVAGGGGGGSSYYESTEPLFDANTKHGQIMANGGAGTGPANTGGAGGQNGQGGRSGSGGQNAGAGGGWLSDGQSGNEAGGRSFSSGGAGGGFGGGFGGGGSGAFQTFGNGGGANVGGGGGGYSGGGGSSYTFYKGVGVGGGGGSYNADPNGTAKMGATDGNSGNGLVTITYMLPCPALTITRQPASGSTVCAGTPVSTFVMVDGSPTTYQWYRGSTLLSSQTSATLTLPSPQPSDAGSYSVVVSSSCTSVTSTAFNLTVNSIPPTPTLLTQTGQSYPGGQSKVTVDVNSGNVNLVVGGCNGTINWRGPNNTSGTTSPIAVATDRIGTFVYQATCTSAQGCTSPAASATVIVQGRLTVLHRDVDNYADNNAIQPLLQLQNQGTTPLPLAKLKLRYYVTVEGGGSLSNLFVDYAQVGGQNVTLRYVPLSPKVAGADGYVEVGFTAAAGNLLAGSNSGNIKTYFAKADYGSLYEPDDYSYNPVRDQLTNNLHITAYYDGALIAGIEPGAASGTPPPAGSSTLRALTESKNGPSATQINTFLEVRNEGTTAINYSELKVRYYFTSDGPERLLVEVDEGAVSARLVKLAQPVSGADTYLELTFTQGGQLLPGTSTGTIRYRISKPEGGRFDQTNDYSYQEQPAERSQNPRVVVLVGSEVRWGTPPAGSARLATSVEPGTGLSVRVLGNPLDGDQLRVEVRGAQGQPLRLSVSDLSGRVVSERQIGVADAVDQSSLNVSRAAAGVLLLQVSSPDQTQTLKILKGQ